MKRWNINKIFFFNSDGEEIREINFDLNSVNIITGASGTGKTAIIKAIDYCLGASKCELAAHIRRRSICVGMKWVAGIDEVIIARVIPPVGQKTSTKMFVRSGRNLEIPKKFKNLDSACTLESAKSSIEKIFGIGDTKKNHLFTGKTLGKASIRNVTPFMFVTKEVIDSEALLFHGMDDPEKAKDFLAALPYYFNVSDEESIYRELQLKKLKNLLDVEENKRKSKELVEADLINKLISFIDEAKRLGVFFSVDGYSNIQIIELLNFFVNQPIETPTYLDNSEILNLNNKRKWILDNINETQSKLNATKKVVREASGYKGIIERQLNKLELINHFDISTIEEKCPVCKSPSSMGLMINKSLNETLLQIKHENISIKRVEPKLLELEESLNNKIRSLNMDLTQLDLKIQSWYRQTEEMKKYDDNAKQQAHLKGRISYFLETYNQSDIKEGIDLNVLVSEIQELESQLDKGSKEIKIKRVEAKVSKYATDNFKLLPTVAPCVGAELEFNALKPEINIVENKTETILKMSDLGSDQNYLAIHISLAFALQKFFETKKTSVPGVLLLDQISRPYFPSNDKDEKEIGNNNVDEDIIALKEHINFIFNETDNIDGLQIILLEHAYFSEDNRYVNATKERWRKGSNKALIPIEWKTRADIKK
ncbi:hypothetical protein PA3_25590 [Acinetobacter pittii]|uniref:DUF3732 domain-containing protein n=1 Tax=Acinetobacter pittii TaxID=48296 RepID=A0A4Y3J8U7_ACIPI|nr:DUF3732 domain-containing protein [Acinetobacter pittii]GEA68401.1 hypothetical protein PA3_25590 [Acinetobacter pittii]